MSIIQKLYKLLLPEKIFQKIKDESQKWFFICKCGFEKSVWDGGGLRFMWSKNKRETKKSRQYHLWRCPNCKKINFNQLIYRP